MTVPSRQLPVLVTVTAAVFVYQLLEAMLAPALPAIMEGVNGSTASVAWVFTGLLLAGAVSMPIVSRLGDIADKRLIFLGVLVITACGVVLAGLATSVVVLALGQILQGVGISLVPLSIGIIREVLPPEHVRRGNGLIMGSLTLSTAAGLVLAGPITTNFGYRWLYWGSLVLIVAVGLVAVRIIPSTLPTERGRIDWLGGALLAGGLLVLLIGITQAASWGWISLRLLAMVIVSFALLIGFIITELRVEQPLVDFRIGGRVVATVSAVSFVVGFATTGAYISIPNIVGAPTATGYGLGGTATTAGFILLPMGLAGAASAALTEMLERKFGPRAVTVLGAGLIIASCVLLLSAAGNASLLALSAGLLGAGMGFIITEVINVIAVSVPADRVSSVSGLSFVLRSVGGTLGAQIGGSILATNVLPDSGLPSWSAFTTFFWLIIIVAVIAAALGAALPTRLSIPERSPAIQL